MRVLLFLVTMHGAFVDGFLSVRTRFHGRLKSKHFSLSMWDDENEKRDYENWIRVTRETSMKRPENMRPCDLREAAPFLYGVSPVESRLRLSAVPAEMVTPHSPSASMLECTCPLAEDEMLRKTVASLPALDLPPTFRLSKFYEAVDALTADVAYRHVGGIDRGIVMVTAHHCHSRKLNRPSLQKNLVLRSYLVGVSKSSLNVRTDAIQFDDITGEEVLVNICHTTMVAVDEDKLKPIRRGSAVPRLAVDPADEGDQNRRQLLVDSHQRIRRRRQRESMQLRKPASKPPTTEELIYLHGMLSSIALERDVPTPRPKPPPLIRDYTFESHFVVYPEKRNAQGTLFGGFIVEQAHNLAVYAASFFARDSPIVPLGMDDAIFLQPIAVGDFVTCTARVVHSTRNTCRVLCHAEVRDTSDPERFPVRSNRMMFSFVGNGLQGRVVPETYAEALMHLDAMRLSKVEGPTDKEAQAVLREEAHVW